MSVPLPTSSSVSQSARRSPLPSLRRSPRARRTPLSLYVKPGQNYNSRRNPLTIMQAKNHGNEPSKGAKIDQELREEEEAELKKKGTFGPQ